MKIKKCIRCDESKPEDVFDKTKDKLGRIDICKLCKFNWKSVVTSAIRRSFARSPKVTEIMLAGRRTVPRYLKSGERHKIDAVEFQCQTCSGWFIRKFISVDHFIPVVSVEEGFQTWDIFIDRINCDRKNLKRICENCHQSKSNLENQSRHAIQDKAALDLIEDQTKAIDSIHHAKDLLKQVKKYNTKTKAEVTRKRAQELILKLKDILERQD